MCTAKWPFLFGAVFTSHLFAQAFEVASIRPAPPPASSPNSIRISSRMSVDTGRLAYTNVTLRDVMKQAYSVRDDQISAPPWTGEARWNIVAKIPEGAPRDQTPRMLQALLADRFKLVLHRETKELSVYVLAVPSTGPKIRPAESASGVNMDFGPSGRTLKGQLTVPRLSDFLSTQLGLAVLDQTGLDGTFQISLQWSPEPAAGLPPGTPADPSPFPSLLTAVREQLGLKLTAQKGPVEFLVVDRLERIPTEN